jgi:hypothetical protein
MANSFQRIVSAGSPQAAFNQINQNFAKLDAEAVSKSFSGPQGKTSLIQGRLPGTLGYGQILYDQAGNAVIYIAVDNNGKPVMKVAKDKQDATTATDDQLVFNSNQNTFKIVQTDTILLTRPSGTSVVSTTIPMPVSASAFLAWGTLTGVSPQLTYPLPYYAPSGTGTMLWGVRAYYDASANNVKFINESYDAGVTGSTYTVSIKYYLLQETLL